MRIANYHPRLISPVSKNLLPVATNQAPIKSKARPHPTIIQRYTDGLIKEWPEPVNQANPVSQPMSVDQWTRNKIVIPTMPQAIDWRM